MNALPPDIAALVGSRICHDLISPLGAIGNGLELLSLSGLPQTPEMSLISESVDNANARIRFFRVAFGHAAEGQSLSGGEIREILAALSGGGRVHYGWAGGEACARTGVRLAFLASLCVETALPLGGDIIISCNAGDSFQVTGTGQRINADPSLWDPLSQSVTAPGLAPAQVQFALLPLVAADLGRRLQVEIDDTALTITV